MMNKAKTNKGITLVALVITIIVLIILAGVSINTVLNGGIITNAKDAKNQYNEGKVKEETALIDLEVQSDFETAVKGEQAYKFQNKFMTGIEPETKVSDIILPDGYKLYKVDGSTITEEEESSTYVSTGMILKKNEKEIGRIVIYGDINCSGTIDSADTLNFQYILEEITDGEDYQKVAMDVNHDGYLNKNDETRLAEYVLAGEAVDQNISAGDPNSIVMYSKKEATEKYMNSLSNEFKQSQYSFEWSEEWGEYILNGVVSETTVGELLNILPSGTEIRRGGRTLSEDQMIEDGNSIWIQDSYYAGEILIAEIVF